MEPSTPYSESTTDSKSSTEGHEQEHEYTTISEEVQSVGGRLLAFVLRPRLIEVISAIA
jgi:hypothetical protein